MDPAPEHNDTPTDILQIATEAKAKYLRRTGTSGHYQYTYRHPQGRQGARHGNIPAHDMMPSDPAMEEEIEDQLEQAKSDIQTMRDEGMIPEQIDARIAEDHGISIEDARSIRVHGKPGVQVAPPQEKPSSKRVIPDHYDLQHDGGEPDANGNDTYVGDRVRIHPQLTVDPYNKRGQEGNVRGYSIRDDAFVVEFDDGSIGFYHTEAVQNVDSAARSSTSYKPPK